MRLQPTQFMTRRVDANAADYLSQYIDQDLLANRLPGLRLKTDLSDMPFAKIMTALADATNYRSPFLDLMDTEGTTRVIDTDFFTHKLVADGVNYFISIEDMSEGDDCPGLGHTDITLKFNKDNLNPGDVIAPLGFKQYPIRVSKPGDKVGIVTNYNGTYEIADQNKYYPKELLRANVKWEKLYHAAGEATSQRGSFSTSLSRGWIEYGGNMTLLTKELKVTDKAHDTFIEFIKMEDSKDPNPIVRPDMPREIIRLAEAEFVMQTRQEEENYLLWGQNNSKPLTFSSTLDPSSTYPVNIGSGFFQYATYGCMREYTIGAGTNSSSVGTIDAEYLKRELVGIVNHRISYDQYNWVAICGGQAAAMLMDDMKKKYGMAAYMTNFTDMTRSAPAIDTVNRQGVEFPTKQFTKMNFDPYGSIRIQHWRDLDDPRFLGGDLMYKGFPISSYWIFFMNLGLRGSSKKNLERLVKRNSEVYAFTCGVYTPLGAINQLADGERNKYTYSSGSKEAAYWLSWQKSIGFNMQDTNNMLWFVPSLSF